MLRDLNVSVNGRRDSTDPRVGVLASEIPTGGAMPAWLLNDIDAGFPNRLYSLEVLTLPSAGVLYLDKRSVGTFTGAPDGVYTGTQRVQKFDEGSGLVSTVDTTYSLTVAAAPVATVTSVVVSPSTATGSTQFSAQVNGANSPSQAVTWSKVGGGTLSTSGNFVAPAATNVVQTITITATSDLNPSKSGTATVTIAAAVVAPPAPVVTGVAVSPQLVALSGGASQQFSVVVSGTNAPSQAGSWTASAGQVSGSGLFSAPAATTSAQEITVTFTSAQDPSWSGHATVVVAAVVVTPPPVQVAIVAPNAPTDVTVVALVEGMLVDAKPPTNPGSSDIIGYTIATSTGQSFDVDALPATIALPALASVFVTVAAITADGTGAASVPSVIATPMAAPDTANTPASVPAPRSRTIYM